MKRITLAAFAATVLSVCASTVMPAVQAQNVASGQQLFEQCAACHEVTATNGLGPGLLGIVGRASASVAGFRYSPALKRANLVWDAKNLDAYLSDPQKLVPGNLMPFSGIDDPQMRADLIAYLQTVK
jgi:cytochrome c